MQQHVDVAVMAKKNNDDKIVTYRQVLDKLSPNPGAEMLWYGRSRPDILSLAQGEGDSATPDFIADAARKAMAKGKTFYGPVLGHAELRQEISNYYAHIYNVNLPTNRIFVTGSGTTAMHLALTSILDEGDEVVAVTPIWKNLLGAVELTQSSVVQVALDDGSDGWSLDLDRLFDSVTVKTKAMLIVTPSNPTGWIASDADIKAILDFARARDIWVISDEVYGRLTYEMERAPSFLDHAQSDDKLYIVNSFSKNWAMTGWRLGWLVGPACAEEKIRDIALYDNMGPASFMQFAAVEALRHGEGFIAEQMAMWRSNRDLLADRFEQNGRIHMVRPASTFYGFFKVDGEPDCVELAKKLIDEAGLSLAPGCAFGDCCASYLRLCFAVSEQRLLDALGRLEKAVN